MYGKSDNQLLAKFLLIFLIILVVVSAVAVPIILANETVLLTESLKSRYEVGTIAENDVRASETFFFLNEVESNQKRESAALAILPIFRHSLKDSNAIMEDLAPLFADYPQVEGVVREALETTLQQGVYNKSDLFALANQNKMRLQLLDSSAGKRLIFHIEEVLSLEESLKVINGEIAPYLSSEEFKAVSAALALHMRPNIYYSEAETEYEREHAALAVEPVIKRIEQGQLIVKKDFIITEDDFRALQAMRIAEVQYSPLQIVGRFIFVVAVTLTVIYALNILFKHTKRQMQYLFIIMGGTLVSQILTYLVFNLVARQGFANLEPFLPYFTLPILVALATNNRLAGLVSGALLGSYALLLPFATPSTFFFVMAVSFCGIYFIRFVYRRLDIVFQWFFCVVAAACIVFLSNLINGISFKHYLSSIMVMTMNISLTFILVSLILPVLEYLANLPTTFRLRELAYSDSPLLVRLSQTAVGTYNHSLGVAELAYNGAKAIDADPLLARVGGLYHDIGKLENPDYFIENQSDHNKHDDLKASLSVSVIKSHVKIGFEKGREAYLPQEVLDIISQHHGNDVIAFFFKKAMDASQNNNSEQVKREDYTYNSQIPQTPEAAIVMLADGIEAASRAIVKPSAQKYEKLINQIINQKIERKQLIGSRLSLTDLDTLAKTFMQTLSGRYHARIEYPQEEEEV